MAKVQQRIGIFGSDTFVGRHIAWHLAESPNIEVVPIAGGESSFPVLKEHLGQLDVVVHAARVHPKDATDVYQDNIAPTKTLLSVLESVHASPRIIFISSTQALTDSPYGRSKKDSAELLSQWGTLRQIPVSVILIPNEFGESAEPGKDSVVSTFCDNIARGQKSHLDHAACVSLVHVRDVAARVFEEIKNPCAGETVVPGTEMTVPELYRVLQHFHQVYADGCIPEFENALHVALFNTLRWHLFRAGMPPQSILVKTDERGSLFEVVKGNSRGQVFVSFSHPGVTRGQHYHTRKIERFCVITGQAEIRLRCLGENIVHTFAVSGDAPVFIDMPTFCTHNITNVGTGMLTTIFWASEPFNEADPDTYRQTV